MSATSGTTAYGAGLIGTTALKSLLDILEVEEGYGEIHKATGPGALYLDSVGHPTIGFGFDLTQGNVMAAVLDGLLPAGDTYVTGQTKPNVFAQGAVAASAAHHPVENAQGVVVYFNWLMTQYNPENGAIKTLAVLTQDLTWA